MDTSPPTKRCTACGDLLPLDAFAWKNRARDIRSARCRPCQRALQRRFYAANADRVKAAVRQAKRLRHQRNGAIIRAAKAVPCADCGQRYDCEQMDFDHVRGSKSFNIGNAWWDTSVERLLAEIAKCDVVCAVCHRLRTVARVSQ